MIHTLHPADIASLLLFLSRSPLNEVLTQDGRGDREGLPAIIPLFRGYMFQRERRRTLVYVDKGLVQGLVSVRGRNGPSAWEIDRLFPARIPDAVRVEMLERSGALGGEVGAEKVFLCLNAQNRLEEAARAAGFRHYLTEALYVMGHPLRLRPGVGAATPRLATKADEQALFRLYSHSVPHQVRCAEGMTLQEWHDSRDSGRPCRELIFESEGEITAWLQVARTARSLRCRLPATRESADLRGIVEYCLAYSQGKRTVYWLVPEFQQSLRMIVEDRGFRHEQDRVCLSKQIAARVKEPQLVPMRA